MRTRRFIEGTAAVFLAVGLSLASPSSHAFSSFYSALSTIYPASATTGCNNCHTSGGGTPLNAYGDAFLAGGAAGATTINSIAGQDSDGDGFINSVELAAGFNAGLASSQPPAPTTTTTTTTTTTAPPTTTTTAPPTTTSTTAATTSTTTAAATTTTTVVSTTTTTIQGAINLTQGWNLIGNGSDAALDVAVAFGDASKVTTVWKWVPSATKWAFFAPSLAGQALTDYATSKGYDVLATVNSGEGFWVNALQPFSSNLPAGNAVPATAFQSKLSTGWNLVSIGESLTPSQFNTALGFNLTTLWAWDNALTKWYFYAPSLEANGTLSGYVASKDYLDFATNNKTLGLGVGFWVNAP